MSGSGIEKEGKINSIVSYVIVTLSNLKQCYRSRWVACESMAFSHLGK